MNEFNYQTVSGDELELNISQLDLNTIEIDVSNLNYKDNRYTAIKYILLLLLLLGGVSVFKSIILNLTLIAFITIRCYFFTLLVKNEKITVTRDFGVQLTTVFAFDRTNSTFIQCAHIHDVVITEVIQDLKVTFMLSFLTEGSWYEHRPIVPILSAVNPRVDVLQKVFNILRRYIS